MRPNYLARKLLVGFVLMIVLAVLINSSSVIAKNTLELYLVVVIILLVILRFIMIRSGKFLRGLEGENDIDDELRNLDAEYILIPQGLDTQRGNIDKIVIGPTGVWAIEVKSHGGHITFDGERLLRNNRPLEKKFLDQAYAEAMTLKDLILSKLGIEIHVHPVVVFSNKWAKVRLGLGKCKGVYVVQKRWLKKLLTEEMSQSLSKDMVAKILNTLSGQ